MRPPRHTSLVLLLMVAVRPLAGQAVTTAIVQGTVAGPDSLPVPGAQVEVTNTETGQFWRLETSDAGRYFFATVTIGGPYRIAVRALGFRAVAKTGIVLSVGQRYRADFFLEPAIPTLAEVVVRSTADPQANHGRTGPAQLIPDSALRQLPNFSREVVDLSLMSPQASRAPPYGDISIGGQSPRYTTFLIDGGQNTDLYYGGVVGRYGLQRSISPEAVAQIQVLAAPADVRNGDFAGGAVNIVTRSGTNEWHGAAYLFFVNDALVGSDAQGNSTTGSAMNSQYGGTLSGPIVKDRLQFFLNAELQTFAVSDNLPFVTSTSGSADTMIGISYQSIARFDSILTHQYNLETGGVGRTDYRRPASDLLVKLSAQAGTNSQLDLSDHYAQTTERSGPDRDSGYYGLGSMSSESNVTENALQLTWRALLDRRWSNEMSLGYLWTQAEDPSAWRADIRVSADGGDVEASPWNAGGYRNVLNTTTAEFTDNATVGLGSHVLTLGTHDVLLHFQDNLFFSGGAWYFESLDSLAQGLPASYDTRLPGPLAPSGPHVNFPVVQLGLYAQDQWAVSREVMLTYGLRLDVPFLPDAGALNQELRDSLGLETGRFPSGNPLWSPRLGVNYDIGGRGSTFLRGSVGLFSGQPPYRWIANGYKDSGGEQLRLVCQGASAPHFDPLAPPTTCGAGAAPIPLITVFDRDLKYPQNWKFALGVDQRLPWGLVATVDLLYTRWVSQLYFTDANLDPPIGTAAGEGGRLLYGTIDSTGNETPSRINPAFGQVVRVTSRGGDNAFLASVQLQREFGGGFGLSASYTYAHAVDAFSQSRFNSPAMLADTPLDGSLADRNFAASFFSASHRVSMTASIALPYRSRLSFIYMGSTQPPYTYVIQPGGGNHGDVNADGINVAGGEFGVAAQDIIYVPRDVRPGGDISLVKLDTLTGTFLPAPASDYDSLNKFITSEYCLDRQRGRIMARNSCSDPWYGQLDARLAVDLPTFRGQSIELSLVVADLPALLHLPDLYPIWTQNKRGIGRSEPPVVPLLELEGYDPVKQRGIYSLVPVQRSAVDFQVWYMQLGVRYTF